jgi:hypothetical protein
MRRLPDELLESLTAQRIGAGVPYRGGDLHGYYRDRHTLAPGDYPVASDISERTLSLPLGPTLSDDDQDDVVRALRSALAQLVSRRGFPAATSGQLTLASFSRLAIGAAGTPPRMS